MELLLTEKERDLLLDLLKDQQDHLLREIARAHHHEFKTTLRDRCALLEGVLDKLQTPLRIAS